MQPPVDTAETHAAANTEDRSICLEAHGFLNQSYDSLDSLLRDLAHAGAAQPAQHAGAAVEVTVIGQPEGLLPFSHLFL
jgi:hypothetical protein